MTLSVTVFGDALLDRDIDGRATHLAPDAPAPVVADARGRVRPGGAALAAVLLARDGADVVLVTAIGDDPAGQELERLLRAESIEVLRIQAPATTQKVRIRADGRMLARLDLGEYPGLDDVPLSGDIEYVIRTSNALLVSDYGNGATSLTGARAAIAARGRRPTVWDPHPRGTDPVAHLTMATPNQREAGARDATLAAAIDAAAMLRHRWNVASVAVTRAGDGAVLATGDDVPTVFPTASTGNDPCGAGDRFAGATLLALAQGALPSEAVRSAVEAATHFVGIGGASAVATELEDPLPNIERSAPAIREPRCTVATSGCFDRLGGGHIASLEAARSLGDRLVVCVNSDQSIRRIRGAGHPVMREADRIAVLRALSCVDEVIVFDEDTPARVLERIRPELYVKGGDYDATGLPEAGAVASWDGRSVVVPYLDRQVSARELQ